MTRIARFALVPTSLAGAAWALLALSFRLPGPSWLTRGIGLLFAAGVVAILVWVRPWSRTAGVLAVAFAVLLAWWWTISPSNDRDWAPEVARPPTAEVRGDTLIVHDVRDFEYRSEHDFTERWEDRAYDLSQIRGLDLFLSYWGSPAIAHTIMSWDFGDGRHLAISIETRKERGEEYSALRGFFRQYELYYVVADERDLIGLRIGHRAEEVHLYRLRVPPEAARALLLDYVRTMNDLAARPRWYNAAVDNCTTGIRVHAQHAGGAAAWDWRLLVNGYVDRMLYERGRIDTSRPFDEVRAASRIDSRAALEGCDRAFSQCIRGTSTQPSP